MAKERMIYSTFGVSLSQTQLIEKLVCDKPEEYSSKAEIIRIAIKEFLQKRGLL